MSRKLIVYGGNGFVGSRVVQRALSANWNVVVARRSGQPVNPKESWVEKVRWASVDALDRPSVYSLLQEHPDTEAVISTVGLLTMDHKKAIRINGDANVNIAASVFESKTVRKFVFVSATDIGPAHRVLKGYYQGKRRADRAILETLPDRGCVLRPAMVYGSRFASGYHIPLGLVGAPMKLVFKPIYSVTGWSLFAPPIEVEDLAEAAVHAAGHSDVVGIQGYYDMKNLAGQYRKHDRTQ